MGKSLSGQVSFLCLDALVYAYDPFLLPSNILTCLLLDGLGSAALDA